LIGCELGIPDLVAQKWHAEDTGLLIPLNELNKNDTAFYPTPFEGGKRDPRKLSPETAGNVAFREPARVFLVDDEETVREVSREVLEALGYQVTTAGDGEEAVRLYQRQWRWIDIVVLDMVMPKMDGVEVYDRMKQINPRVKVLVITGCGSGGKTMEILNKGCDGCIQKPFGISDLSLKIRDICETGTASSQGAP
jgi:CheY-like chemotaxis protein